MAIYILARAVYWFCEVIIYLLLARCILSWFVRDPYTTMGKIYGFTIKLTEPVAAPCRALLSRVNTGMFDFSLLLAVLLMELVESLLMRLLVMFL